MEPAKQAKHLNVESACAMVIVMWCNGGNSYAEKRHCGRRKEEAYEGSQTEVDDHLSRMIAAIPYSTSEYDHGAVSTYLNAYNLI
jgi:hypothetical protein